MTSHRSSAHLVWGIALFAYMMAVSARAAFGVAGLDAQERYHANAGILATFAVLQLGVYAAAQVPMGVLLDRYGSRVMLGVGMSLITVGTVTLALTSQTGVAIFARFLTGAGDAAIFVSVVRLLVAWFPPTQVPVYQQVTGVVGQLGQLISATPLSFALHHFGWSTSFLAISSLTALGGALALLIVRNQPPLEPVQGGKRPLREVGVSVSAAVRTPGTRLGFWGHFISAFAGHVFGLLWGVPFLVLGQGLSRSMAASMLTVMVVCGMIFGPIMGQLAAKFPLRRSNLILASTVAMVASWSLLLLWPGRAPLWVIMVTMACMAAGSTASMVSLDFARTFNPRARAGVATGIVNVGGFVAALVVILAIGLILDALAPDGRYTLRDFKIAFLVQYPLWIGGLLFLLHERRSTIRGMAAEGIERERTFAAVRRRWLDR